MEMLGVNNIGGDNIGGEKYWWRKCLVEKIIGGDQYWWTQILVEKIISGDKYWWRKEKLDHLKLAAVELEPLLQPVHVLFLLPPALLGRDLVLDLPPDLLQAPLLQLGQWQSVRDPVPL